MRTDLRITKGAAIVGLSLLAATTPFAQDAKIVVANAFKVIGGDTVRTIEYSGSGYDFAFGQAYSPTSPWPKFAVKSYTRAIDFDRSASQVKRVRTQFENPPRGGGQQPIAGEQAQTQTILGNGNTPWAQQVEIWMTPHGFLRAAAARPITMRTQTIGGKRYSVVTFAGDNGAQVNGYINERNEIERVDSRIDNPMLGDMLYESVYSDYQAYGSVKFPTHIVQAQGGAPILDIVVSDVKANAPVTIQGPNGGGAVVGVDQATGQRPPTEKIADGVYLILGAAAISVAFDFKDYAVVMEAPGNEMRGEAVIAETKRLIPNKPIKYVINTHHHFDHSSGLRPFVAEGATIVTHNINKAYYEKALAAPRTLNPDRLQQTPKGVSVEAVADKKVLTDGKQLIELYHVRDNLHNAGLLFAYLPKSKILIQADMLGAPPATGTMPINTFGENFMSNLDRLRLEVNRMVPIHYPADAKPILWADVLRSLGRSH